MKYNDIAYNDIADNDSANNDSADNDIADNDIADNVIISTWEPYLIFVTSTTSGAGVKIFRPVSKKCELFCFGVKIMNFVFFGVKKSGISVFLVSVENGAGVKKMTNFRYGQVVLMALEKMIVIGRSDQKLSFLAIFTFTFTSILSISYFNTFTH